MSIDEYFEERGVRSLSDLVEATRSPRYEPAPKWLREILKETARATLRSSTSTPERVAAAEWMGVAYYDRSLECAKRFDCREAHPDFSTYIRMLDVAHYFDETIVRELRCRYGDAIVGAMRTGDSYWRG